jgi:lipoate---protein ligase
MLFVDNQGSTRPQINLAIEEYILRNIMPEDDLLSLYINEPSIIVGRFQNTLEEVNQAYVEEHGIQVVRRLSGGGAVYHDLKNLNYSFITPKDPESISNFKKFTAPVIRTLRGLGVPAEMGTRNDILVAGRKISGNAQYITANRMVSHGTLLFDSDLSRLGDALHVVPGQITSKGIKSIRSQVTNIAKHLPERMEMADFREQIVRGIFSGADPVPQYHLAEPDWQAIRKLADERYLRWEWNYGSSPDFKVHKTRRFPPGDITVNLEVHQGYVQSIDFQGDFLPEADKVLLARCLEGVRYDRHTMRTALEGSRQSLSSAELSISDWIHLLYR